MTNWLPASFTSAFTSPSLAPASGTLSENISMPESTPFLSSSIQTSRNFIRNSETFDPSLITSEEQISTLVSLLRQHGTTDDRDQVDSHIAQALSNLSVQDRDKVYHEIHGVDDMIEETPELIQQSLQELHAELSRIKDKHPKGGALRMALQQHPSSHAYVFDSKLGLRFLRADSFDVIKAADRMIRFFDLKLYLFGPELLCQEITMDDLSQDACEFIQAGFLQLLPARDRAGRAILMLVPTFRSFKKYAEQLPWVLFYMVMCSLDDEETQKRGLTAIRYDFAIFDTQRTDFKTIARAPWVMSTIPVKFNAFHHCFKDRTIRIYIDLSMKFFPREITARTKVHQGTPLECQYALMTFGIPLDALCVSMDGELKRKNHLEWIKMRKRQEFISRDTKGMPLSYCPPRIIAPSRADVLFGRGKTYREHIGNMRLNNLLDENLDRYDELEVEEKPLVVSEMVAAIRAEGGRFIDKKDGLCWEEVDDKQAREKVYHAFRTRRRIHQSADKKIDEKGTYNTLPHIRSDDQSRPADDETTLVGIKRARTRINHAPA